MTAITIDQPRQAPENVEKLNYAWCESGGIECRAIFLQEEDGRFSAYASRLPGVFSEGDTLDDAMKNIADAFGLSIVSYRALGKEIPWIEEDFEKPRGAIERWIVVHV